MPRYHYSDSIDAHNIAKHEAIDDEDHKRIVAQLTKHHPMTHPDRKRLVPGENGELCIRVPDMYCRNDQFGARLQETRPWKRGAICFGLPGYGFFVVLPGGHVDIDITVPESVVKDVAPHLLTEAEHAVRKTQTGELNRRASDRKTEEK